MTNLLNADVRKSSYLNKEGIKQCPQRENNPN